MLRLFFWSIDKSYLFQSSCFKALYESVNELLLSHSTLNKTFSISKNLAKMQCLTKFFQAPAKFISKTFPKQLF